MCVRHGEDMIQIEFVLYKIKKKKKENKLPSEQLRKVYMGSEPIYVTYF